MGIIIQIFWHKMDLRIDMILQNLMTLTKMMSIIIASMSQQKNFVTNPAARVSWYVYFSS